MLYSLQAGGDFVESMNDIRQTLDLLDLHFPFEGLNESEVLGDIAFANQLALGVLQKSDELDELIESTGAKWKTSRMDYIDLCLLRMGAFELCSIEGIPPAVTINEAVELASEYGSDRSASFVNGILDEVKRRTARDPHNN